jgi:hypothetical protein
MRADCEASAVEVGDQTLFVVHGLKRRVGVGLELVFEKRAGSANGALDLPEGVAAVEVEFRVSRFRLRVRRNFRF